MVTKLYLSRVSRRQIIQYLLQNFGLSILSETMYIIL